MREREGKRGGERGCECEYRMREREGKRGGERGCECEYRMRERGREGERGDVNVNIE